MLGKKIVNYGECQHCDEPLQFDIKDAGQFVCCPCCKEETRLLMIGETRQGPPNPMSLDLSEDYNLTKKPTRFPSVQQLAIISATLARNTKHSPDELADFGMKLWLAARKRLTIASHEEEIHNQDIALDKALFPKDEAFQERSRIINDHKEYPVTRDKFLRMVLPKFSGRTADLARYGKAFLREFLRDKKGQEPTPEAIAQAFGNWPPTDNKGELTYLVDRFMHWHKNFQSEIRSAAGKKSATKKKSIRADQQKKDKKKF